MNLSPKRRHEPEINLTPLIDVVFLMLIFFMVSTTFIQQTRLDVSLPSASAVAQKAEADALHLTIDAQGNMFLDDRRLRNGRRETIERALAEALAGRDPGAAHLIIDADARARHQMVIRALDAAGRAGVSRWEWRLPPNRHNDQRNVPRYGVYRRLLGYVRPYWPLALAAVVGMVISGGMETVFAWLMKPMLDSGFVERDPAFIRLLPFALMGIFLVRGGASFAATFGMMWISRRVIHRLRAEVFDRLLTLPKSYFDNASSARLLSRLTYNVEQVAKAGTDALIVLIRDSATALALLGYMFFVSWRLALIFLALGPALAFVVVYISKRFRRISRRIQRSVGSVAYVAEEAIEGHEVIKVFGAEAHERERFAGANDRNMRQYMKFAATKALSTPVVQFISAAALSLVIYLATLEGMVAEITVGGFVSFITAMLLLMQPLKRLTNVNATIQRGIAAGESIFEIIDETPEPDDGNLPLQRVEGALVFDGVSFAYGRGNPLVLEDVSLEIRPGETVAIVGRSGSGKTTLVSLLPRFYDPMAGEIRLEGVALANYRLADLRRQIALVGQQVVLFNDTLAANIAYGAAGEADKAAVRRAADLANAREFIEALPEGFDTVVGENGVMLSGGQRQRIAIARALLKDAPILILDEATSALDTESEAHIQHALETLMARTTTLVIAHRLSTVEAADRIVVLDGGRVVETGDHQDLLARNGAYAALYNMQFRRQAQGK